MSKRTSILLYVFLAKNKISILFLASVPIKYVTFLIYKFVFKSKNKKKNLIKSQ